MFRMAAAIVSDRVPGGPGKTGLWGAAAVAADQAPGRLARPDPNWSESRFQRRSLYPLGCSTLPQLSRPRWGRQRSFPEDIAPIILPVIRKKADRENKPPQRQ